MSTEAQFYEARRRQHGIERRQSLRTEKEIDKQARKSEYQALLIPIRLVRQDNKHTGRCTCISVRPTKLTTNDRALYQRDRDIYPRPVPLTTDIRRHNQHGKIPHRFSSTEYLQQW